MEASLTGGASTVVVSKVSVTSAGFTADALHRNPLNLNLPFTKRLTVVPRSVVMTEVGASVPQ